jgi:hypothetical protein
VELEQTFDDILQEIDDLINATYAKLSPNGDVYNAVNASKATLDSIASLLDQCDSVIGTDANIQSVLETLKEIKQVLSITP